jgi:hypothetical protein
MLLPPLLVIGLLPLLKLAGLQRQLAGQLIPGISPLLFLFLPPRCQSVNCKLIARTHAALRTLVRGGVGASGMVDGVL